MRTGIRLGIDVGTARIGVARSDPHGILATPVETITLKRAKQQPTEPATRIVELAAEYEAIEVIVGLPLNLHGASTQSTQHAQTLAAQLVEQLPAGITVRMVDERLSTVSAQHALHGSGRNSKQSRAVIDQVAAVIILQQALDSERSSGKPPGDAIVATKHDSADDPTAGRGNNPKEPT